LRQRNRSAIAVDCAAITYRFIVDWPLNVVLLGLSSKHLHHDWCRHFSKTLSRAAVTGISLILVEGACPEQPEGIIINVGEFHT
jgi:hypothetical protein